MYRAKSGNHEFDITVDDDGMTVNGKRFDGDIVCVRENFYSVLYNGKSFTVEVTRADRATRTLDFKINQTPCSVQLRNKFDLLLERMGMNSTQAAKVNMVKAPMPGLIIDLRVREGDVVRQHDPLVVLEAMKMENIIKSPGAGIIKKVHVEKGQGVEKNQILLEF